MSGVQWEVVARSQHRKCFESSVTNFYRGRETSLKRPWTRDRVSQVMNHVRQFKISKYFPTQKSSKDYYYSKRYESIVIENRPVLIRKRKSPEEVAVRIVPLDEYFDILYDCHVSIGHGGRDKMLHVLQSNYLIPKPIVEMFIKCCQRCNERKVKKKMVKPEVTSRGQVDVVDMTSVPDNSYRWLLVYQNRTASISQLRPLKSDGKNEIAEELAKIFVAVGVPESLGSELGNSFVSGVLGELRTYLPEHNIILEQFRSTDTTSNIQSFDSLIRQWMRDNNSPNWSLGCHFIQFTINSGTLATITTTQQTSGSYDPETWLMELNSDEILQEVFPEILAETEQTKNYQDQQNIIQDICDDDFQVFSELFVTEALELLEEDYDILL